MADTPGPNQLFEQWRKQFEEGAQAWSRLITQTAATAPSPTPDPTAFWRPVLDQGVQAWAKLFAQTPATPELLTQWKQFLDQWIEAWSKVLGQASRSQLTAIAKQIVELEDRIDRLEDSISAKLRRLTEREPR
jgi:hypothetical protein